MYQIVLASCGNPDRGQNPNESISPTKIVVVNSIEECQVVVSKYVDDYDLGAGNYAGGQVYQDGDYIGRVSYNGRFWDKYSKYGRL